MVFYSFSSKLRAQGRRQHADETASTSARGFARNRRRFSLDETSIGRSTAKVSRITFHKRRKPQCSEESHEVGSDPLLQEDFLYNHMPAEDWRRMQGGSSNPSFSNPSFRLQRSASMEIRTASLPDPRSPVLKSTRGPKNRESAARGYVSWPILQNTSPKTAQITNKDVKKPRLRSNTAAAFLPGLELETSTEEFDRSMPNRLRSAVVASWRSSTVKSMAVKFTNQRKRMFSKHEKKVPVARSDPHITRSSPGAPPSSRISFSRRRLEFSFSVDVSGESQSSGSTGQVNHKCLSISHHTKEKSMSSRNDITKIRIESKGSPTYPESNLVGKDQREAFAPSLQPSASSSKTYSETPEKYVYISRELLPCPEKLGFQGPFLLQELTESPIQTSSFAGNSSKRGTEKVLELQSSPKPSVNRDKLELVMEAMGTKQISKLQGGNFGTSSMVDMIRTTVPQSPSKFMRVRAKSLPSLKSKALFPTSGNLKSMRHQVNTKIRLGFIEDMPGPLEISDDDLYENRRLTRSSSFTLFSSDPGDTGMARSVSMSKRVTLSLSVPS